MSTLNIYSKSGIDSNYYPLRSF